MQQSAEICLIFFIATKESLFLIMTMRVKFKFKYFLIKILIIIKNYIDFWRAQFKKLKFYSDKFEFIFFKLKYIIYSTKLYI